MKRGIETIVLAVLIVACGAEVPAEENVGPEGKPVATVAFTEGPTVDAEGSVYFTETRSSRIMKYTPGAGVETFRENSNGANGLVFDSEWRLIAAEGGPAPRVTRTDIATGEIEVIADSFEGKPLVRPNDVTVDGKGRIYFTDYAGGAIYRIDPDGTLAQLVAAPDIEVPNGIIISPDDQTLYHVEANGKEGGARMLRAYDLAEDGSISNMRVFHDFYPGRSADGIAVDSAGNVYAAAGLHRRRGSSETLDTKPGVHVFSPAGELLKFYPIPEDTITNLAFGGDDLKTLYVTAGKGLYTVPTDIAGTRR